MMEQRIVQQYLQSAQNKYEKALAVNSLRHLSMDQVSFNTKDDSEYMLVFGMIMQDISSKYPFLSIEVQRQMAKKSRRQVRKSLEKRQTSVHI